MPIAYRDTKEFTAAQLKDLFLSVGWESGKYPDRLQAAMRNCDRVASAWDGDMLAGLMTGISDQVMTAYFHYLLVRPEYQDHGIGKKLVEIMLEHYSGCMKKVLISYNSQIGFYERCGFHASNESTPMFAADIKF